MVQMPYDISLTPQIGIANMQAKDVEGYELNSTLIFSRYEVKNAIRYNDRDEFLGFKANYVQNGNFHTISARKALLQGNVVTLSGDVIYTNSDNLDFQSNLVSYDLKMKTLTSILPFIITQGGNKITGKSAVYDMENKKLYASEVSGWMQRK